MSELLLLTRYGADEEADRSVYVVVGHIICFEPHAMQDDQGQLKPIGTKLWLTGVPGPLIVNESVNYVWHQVRKEEI